MKKCWTPVISALLISLFLSLVRLPLHNPARAGLPAARDLALLPALAQSGGGGDHSVYLPFLVREPPVRIGELHEIPSLFGIEVHTSFQLDDLPDPEMYWTRINGLLWSDVEPEPGARDWEALASLEEQFIAASREGMAMIVVVRGAPEWARAIPGEECSPVREDKLEDFGRFLRDLVARYSRPPYSVKFWELWNEPDVSLSARPPNSPQMGCWGDPHDPYYGGEAYAEMLKVAYPSIKRADPEAQVLVGGLLLDCNPALKDQCRSGEGLLSARFLEGVLRRGGDYFNGISFHAYDYAGNEAGLYTNLNWNSYYHTTGPVVIAKVAHIKKMLAKYGLEDKYLINTEAAVVIDHAEGDDAAQLIKAYYVPQVYAATYALGPEMVGSIWYSSYSGWRNVDLFAPGKQPTLAYTAFQTAARMLRKAEFAAYHHTPDELMVYEFDKGGKKLWVIWGLQDEPRMVGVPGKILKVVDVFGEPEHCCEGSSVLVGRKPLYVTWTP